MSPAVHKQSTIIYYICPLDVCLSTQRRGIKSSHIDLWLTREFVTELGLGCICTFRLVRFCSALSDEAWGFGSSSSGGSPILSQGKWGEYAQRDHEKKPPRRLRYIACMPVETRSNTPGQVVLRFSTSSIQCLYKIPYTRGSIANPWRKTMQQSNTSVTSADISVCPRAVH